MDGIGDNLHLNRTLPFGFGTAPCLFVYYYGMLYGVPRSMRYVADPGSDSMYLLHWRCECEAVWAVIGWDVGI